MKRLLPPILVFTNGESGDNNPAESDGSNITNNHNDALCSLLCGSLSVVGDGDMWMLGSSHRSNGSIAFRNDVSVGPLPGSNFGCTLRTGQSVRRGRQSLATAIGGDDRLSTLFPNQDGLDQDLFLVHHGTLTTPAFVPSLINSLLFKSTKSSNTNKRNGRTTDIEISWVQKQTQGRHFESHLTPTHRGDSAFIALRLLVLRCVELMTKEKDSEKKVLDARDASATTLFASVIETVGRNFPTIQFSSMLLGIGRQVEPSCLRHMFPLPQLEDQESNGSSVNGQSHKNKSMLGLDRCEYLDMKSVEDLYLACTSEGALSTPAASLPLLPSKMSSLEECQEILYHCLSKLRWNSLDDANPNNEFFDWSRPERSFLRDLFRFGTKLEDMDQLEFWSDDTVIDISMPNIDSAMSAPTQKSHVELPSSPVIKQKRLESTKTEKKASPSLASYILPSSIICSGRKRREQRAVFEAASTFVMTGFEETDYDFLDPVAGSDGGGINDDDSKSMAWIVSKLVVQHALFERKRGWRRTAMVSRLILGNMSVDPAEASRRFTKWAMNLSLVTLGVASHQLSQSRDGLDIRDADELHTVVSHFLSSGIFSANHELQRTDAIWILDLVLLLIHRMSSSSSLSSSHLQNVVVPGLVFVGIMAGHVAGRVEEIFAAAGSPNKLDKSALKKCYELAKVQLANI